jgi:hypothetical protein
MEGSPELIALNPDGFHAKCVGRTMDGRQFFITTHVDPKCRIHGHAFVALYFFNVEGTLLEAKIDDVGELGSVDREAWCRLVDQRFSELGWTTLRRIVMKPFVVERFGLKFGLIVRSPKETGATWAC